MWKFDTRPEARVEIMKLQSKHIFQTGLYREIGRGIFKLFIVVLQQRRKPVSVSHYFKLEVSFRLYILLLFGSLLTYANKAPVCVWTLGKDRWSEGTLLKLISQQQQLQFYCGSEH